MSALTCSPQLDMRTDFVGTVAQLTAMFQGGIGVPRGTTAFTTDQGPVYWSGAAWVALAAAQNALLAD